MKKNAKTFFLSEWDRDKGEWDILEEIDSKVEKEIKNNHIWKANTECVPDRMIAGDK